MNDENRNGEVFEVRSDDSGDYENAEVVYDKNDVKKDRFSAAAAYFLFFIPLITCPDSLFARFHANQGLALLLTALCGNFIITLLPIFVRWAVRLIFFGTVLVFALIGCVSALAGKTYELPLIGRFRLLR